MICTAASLTQETPVPKGKRRRCEGTETAQDCAQKSFRFIAEVELRVGIVLF